MKFGKQKLGMTTQGGIATSGGRVFVETSNGWLKTYGVEDPRLNQWQTSTSASLDSPLLVTDELILWSNSTGLVQALAFDSNKSTLQFEAGAPLSAGMGYYPPLAFIPVRGHQVYAIFADKSRRLGTTAWRYFAPSEIVSAPIGMNGLVFVSTRNDGLIALKMGSYQPEEKTGRKNLAAADGAEAPAEEAKPVVVTEASGGIPVWQSIRARKFLAASPTRVYTLDLRGNLLILDAKTGAELGVLPANDNDFYVPNTKTDRIYLAAKNGLVQCLREAESTTPVVYAWPAKKDEKDAKKPAAPADGAEPAAKQE